MVVLTNKQLRKIIEKLPRVKGTKKFPNYSVVNEGYPGKFNLSFTEAEMLDEFDSYLNFSHDLIYSKIQHCIRNIDFEKLLEDKNDKTHLALFELADIHGQMILSSNEKTEEKLRFAIEHIWNFLTKIMGFSSEQIYISSCKGGKSKEITNGRYNIKKEIPKEELALRIWKEVGLKNIKFTNEETFLSLNMQRPTPWGYRNEIFVKIDGKLLDVATLEYLIYEPIFKNGKIVDIKIGNFLLVISGVGIERILISKNKYKKIIECDHIVPIYKKVLSLAKNKDEHKSLIVTESLRVIHRVFTDSKGYSNLSKTRKELIKKYLRALRDNLKYLEIPKEEIKDLLILNSKLQDYYSELKRGEKQTYRDIIKYIKTLDDLEKRGKLK